MQALMLWQHWIMQAVSAQAQARPTVLATAWSGNVWVSQRWQRQLLLRRCSNVQGCLFAQLPSWNSSKVQGSSGESAGHAAVGKWQLWVLHRLMEASLDQECGWHSAAAFPSLILSADEASDLACRSWRVFTFGLWRSDNRAGGLEGLWPAVGPRQDTAHAATCEHKDIANHDGHCHATHFRQTCLQVLEPYR